MEKRPQLVINRSVLRSNLNRIIKKTRPMSIELRPHVKTIHDPQLSSILKSEGISKICVSNMVMLVSFLKAGWRDICFAIPFPVTACDDINHLLDQYPDLVLTLYVDHIDQLKALSKVHSPVNISIEIDAGQHRSGVDWKSERQCHDLIQTTHASHHHFSGLTSHFGFLYSCQTKDEIIQSSSQAMMKILQLKEHLESSFSKTVSVAIGDTPSLLAMSFFDHVDEIRAGNFLVNDLTIASKQLCHVQDIACALKAVVIGKYVDDSRLVLHCGSVHLSKEGHVDSSIGYGHIALVKDDWLDGPLEGAYIHALYQEHAVIHATPEILASINLGDSLYVIPVHSCLAIDAMYHQQQLHFISE